MAEKKKLVSTFNIVNSSQYYVVTCALTLGVAIGMPTSLYSSKAPVQDKQQHDAAILNLQNAAQNIITRQQEIEFLKTYAQDTRAKQLSALLSFKNEIFTNAAISEAEASDIQYTLWKQANTQTRGMDLEMLVQTFGDPLAYRDECMTESPGDATQIFACAQQKVADHGSSEWNQFKDGVVDGSITLGGTLGLSLLGTALQRRQEKKTESIPVSPKMAPPPPPPPPPEQTEKPSPAKPSQGFNI